LHGGAQERRWRPGTENVPAIAGFGAAAERARALLAEGVRHLRRLDGWLEDELSASGMGGHPVGPRDPVRRVPGVRSWVFPGLDGDALRTALDLRGVRVGAGAACSSGSVEPSHVLLAMGYPVEVARTVVRLSPGWTTGEQEVERAVRAFRQAAALQGVASAADRLA